MVTRRDGRCRRHQSREPAYDPAVARRLTFSFSRGRGVWGARRARGSARPHAIRTQGRGASGPSVASGRGGAAPATPPSFRGLSCTLHVAHVWNVPFSILLVLIAYSCNIYGKCICLCIAHRCIFGTRPYSSITLWLSSSLVPDPESRLWAREPGRGGGRRKTKTKDHIHNPTANAHQGR